MIRKLAHALLVGALGLLGSGCLSASLDQSLKVEHPSSWQETIDTVHAELGEPVWTVEYAEPMMLGRMPAVRAALGAADADMPEQAQGVKPWVGDRFVVSRSEVFVITGVPRDHFHHPPYTLALYSLSMAAGLELFGVEALAPTAMGILILDVPLSLIVIYSHEQHKRDQSPLTYWFDEHGNLVQHVHMDLRTTDVGGAVGGAAK